MGCWSHARRAFDEALKALPASVRSAGPGAAEGGLDFCNRLFRIERHLKDVAPEQRQAEREAQSRPVLNAFRAGLDEQAPKVLPKSPLGKAITTCRNQWPKLLAFMEDGRLELDNNRSERSIKPFVIGRKNWLFANTPRGARASAIIYSLVQTAKENQLKPFDYLTHLFEQLPNLDTSDPAVLDALLPWSESLPESCKMRTEKPHSQTADSTVA